MSRSLLLCRVLVGPPERQAVGRQRDSLSEFEQAFRSAVNDALCDAPAVRYQWINEREVRFEASSADGFDLSLVCEAYGVYAYSGGWHGAPWDVTIFSPSELYVAIREFVRSVLSESSCLEVRYANNRPYRWSLHRRVGEEDTRDVTGKLFFNWFGRRSSRLFRNS
jgi:hypothetical protein